MAAQNRILKTLVLAFVSISFMPLQMALNMKLDQYLASSILIAMAIIIFIFFIQGERCKNKGKKALPPGRMGLPWIGETVEFVRAQRKNRLYEDFFQPRIMKYGKIYKMRLMGSPTIVVNGAEANRFFLSNEFKLVVSSWPSSSVQLMGKDCIMQKQGEAHRCLRGIIATTLSSSGLETIVPRICSTVQLHLQKYWYGQNKISLYCLTKVLTFNIVFECLLGIDVEEGMLTMFERVLEGVFAPPIKFPGSKFSKATSARWEIEKVLIGIVRRKRKDIEGSLGDGKKEGMLLTRLVEALIRGEITEEEVVHNVVLLVFAAHDTTSFAIAMTFKMLAHHPNCYSLLVQEHLDIMSNKRPVEILTLEDTKKMKFSWQVARETMRLFPPIFGSFRRAIVDIEYEGFTIPKGYKVLWTACGTHYDDLYFQDPLVFDPSRFEEPTQPWIFLPFGGGPRLCAGYQLAKLNILIYVHYVVTQYNWSLLYPDEPITMDPLPFPAQGMPIKISSKVL